VCNFCFCYRALLGLYFEMGRVYLQYHCKLHFVRTRTERGLYVRTAAKVQSETPSILRSKKNKNPHAKTTHTTHPLLFPESRGTDA
jgi:hypothetical protein